MNLSQKISANTRHKGVALLIAVIFTSVILAFALLIGNLAYKQVLITNTASGAQKAFYVADAGLECILYADQVSNVFQGPSSQKPTFTCAGQSVTAQYINNNGTRLAAKDFDITNSIDGKSYCVSFTYTGFDTPVAGRKAYVFATGYDVSCQARSTSPYFTSRGLEAIY